MPDLKDLPWMYEAYRDLGTDEVKDAKLISSWVKDLNVSWFTKTFNSRTVPWCGVFVAHCMKVSGYKLPTYWMRASDWLNWGTKLTGPRDGCVVVFSRDGGGHVAFVIGQTKTGQLICLGGNQSDRVTIAKFEKERAQGYVWPSDSSIPPGILTTYLNATWPKSVKES